MNPNYNKIVISDDEARIAMRGIVELILKKYNELRNCVSYFKDYTAEDIYARLSVEWKDGKILVTWESMADF